MTDPLDRLGRLAAHAAVAYDHPTVSEETVTDYWTRLYANEADKITDADLATEHRRAVGAVAECGAALEAATARCRGFWHAESWETEQEKRANAIERDNLRHRLVRLVGRRDALAAETERRAGR